MEFAPRSMTIPTRFDRTHGKGASARLRSMLGDPGFAYQLIANKFGLTRQYIAQLANELGINGRQRERVRLSRREPRIIKKFTQYPSDIRAVMNKLRQAGLRVTPYNSPQPSTPNLLRTSLKMILVNGALCTIQVRPAFKFRADRYSIVRFCPSTYPSSRRPCRKASKLAALRAVDITSSTPMR